MFISVSKDFEAQYKVRQEYCVAILM